MKKVLLILGYLSDEDIDWIMQTGVRATVPQGDVLIQAGQAVSEIFISLTGELSIQSGNQEIARRYPGEILGELSFLDSRPPRESVLAATDVSVIAIDRAKLTAKLQQDVSFAARFYQSLGVLLCSRFRQTMGQLTLNSNEDELDQSVDSADEIDPELLDHMAIAGHRFEMLLEHFLRK